MRPIAIIVQAEEVHLTAEQAVLVGLIVDELLTNAFKHAFPGNRAGTIEVMLKTDASTPAFCVNEDTCVDEVGNPIQPF